jgi:hypothetical protein
MKSLRIAVAVFGLVAAALAGPASAAPQFYSFVVSFFNVPNNGPVAGQHSTGVVSVDGTDCPAGICTGTFFPGDPAHTLLAFNITVGGIAFSVANDSPPQFPQFGFDALGHLNFLNYDGIANGNELILFGSLSSPVTPALATFVSAQGSTSRGIAGIPEPGTAPLLGGALLAGLAFCWLRKRDTGA